MSGTIRSVNRSGRKGGRKFPIREGTLVRGRGLEGDGHAGPGPRQVSLLAWEGVEAMRAKGTTRLECGSFGENLTTEGLDLRAVAVGDRLRIGERAVVAVTRKGKECPQPCRIFREAGYCIMPEQGVFGRIAAGGEVRPGDTVVVERADKGTLAAGVVVVSDSAFAGKRRDGCVAALAGVLGRVGAEIVSTAIVPDDIRAIRRAVRRMTDVELLPLVLTAGGTGLSPRDVTPEALTPLLERMVPGLPEAMRREGERHTPTAILSRGVAGARAGSLVIALPGSPRGASECLMAVRGAIAHACELLRGGGRECAKLRRKHQTRNE